MCLPIFRCQLMSFLVHHCPNWPAQKPLAMTPILRTLGTSAQTLIVAQPSQQSTSHHLVQMPIHQGWLRLAAGLIRMLAAFTQLTSSLANLRAHPALRHTLFRQHPQTATMARAALASVPVPVRPVARNCDHTHPQTGASMLRRYGGRWGKAAKCDLCTARWKITTEGGQEAWTLWLQAPSSGRPSLPSPQPSSGSQPSQSSTVPPPPQRPTLEQFHRNSPAAPNPQVVLPPQFRDLNLEAMAVDLVSEDDEEESAEGQ